MADHPDLDPTSTALLVMDFQNGIVGRLPDPDPLLGRVGATVADVRARGGHVGWVRVGAFATTDLDRMLRERGVTTPVLAGISTSGVVLSTVREAMDRDYRILVLRDCCADPDTEVHDFLTGRTFPRHTTVLDGAELAGAWR